MHETTVFYYTANVENEVFESNVRQKLLEVIGDLPLISVSQKPLLEFGRNICIGEHDNCYGNLFRQLQIGLREIKTPYVFTAEADTIYPPEYFKFQPIKKAFYYRYNNVWVHYNLIEENWLRTPVFFYKASSNAAQLVNRDYWLSVLDWALEDKKEWFSKKDESPPVPRMPTDRRFLWKSDNPVITFKTGKGVNKFTKIVKKVSSEDKLPYWGLADDLRKRMFS